MAEQPLPPGGHRRADRVPGEQPLVERRHELRRRDRVHAVGHRHHRRRAAAQQPRGHRGLQLLADRAGLARVQHHHRHPRRRQHLRHPRRRHRIPAPVRRPGRPALPRPPRPGTSPARPPRPPGGPPARRGRRNAPPGTAPPPPPPPPGSRPGHPGSAGAAPPDRHWPRTASSRSSSGRAIIRYPTSAVPAGRLITISTRSRPPRHVEGRAQLRRRQAPVDPGHPGIQRQRQLPRRITHQLPRQPQQRRRARPEHHLHPGRPGPHPLVGIPRRARAEHRPEHRLAPRRPAAPPPRAPVLVHPERRPQVILQIPAQILQRIGVQRPGQRARLPRRPAGQLTLQPWCRPTPARRRSDQQTAGQPPANSLPRLNPPKA